MISRERTVNNLKDILENSYYSSKFTIVEEGVSDEGDEFIDVRCLENDTIYKFTITENGWEIGLEDFYDNPIPKDLLILADDVENFNIWKLDLFIKELKESSELIGYEGIDFFKDKQRPWIIDMKINLTGDETIPVLFDMKKELFEIRPWGVPNSKEGYYDDIPTMRDVNNIIQRVNSSIPNKNFHYSKESNNLIKKVMDI